ncbi:MAG: response regulator [Ignavibacteriaceae bacterium]|nr:response regulator [Ignavibacteriaceae bacterium]
MEKILIIEDDDSIRQSMREILEEEGFNILTAANGREGVVSAKDYIPDLIVCDIMMPELDGYGVLETLQQDSHLATVPFIFLSAKADKSDIRRGMELGADDFLHKPFTIEELLTAIDSRIRKTQNQRILAEKRLDDLRKSIAFSLPHELNTPLLGIIGFAEVLKNESQNMNAQEIGEMAGYIYDSALRLRGTIEKIILHAKVSLLMYNFKEIENLRQNLAVISQDYLVEHINSIRKDNERTDDLIFSVEEGELLIHPDYFKIVFEEIIDNALKFSKPGSRVLITGKNGVRNYWLTIYDRGRGMSAEQLSKIGAFMQFNRESFEQQGSGLGMAIAKKIMELFAGNYRVTSELGLGTTVTLEFKKKIALNK